MSPQRFALSSLACRSILIPFSIIFLPLVLLLGATPRALPTRAQINDVMAELSQITGLRVKHPVQFRSISRDEVSRYLNDRASQSISAKDIEAQETALKLLGFVPSDFDLRKTTLALMAEQAAAFYDYHRKALFLTDWAPGAMRDTAVVHELAHALADQNFNLGHFVGKAGNDEASTARDAVVEGQASYLMEAYDLLQDGKKALSVHPDFATLDDPANPSGDYPVFDKAPLYLRQNLVFPYTWGMAFQASVIDRLGKDGFAQVFRHPPDSTHQIYHPEIYLAGQKVEPLRIPGVPKGSKLLIGGELGELDHRILLEQYLSRPTAMRVGPEWRGGFFQVLEDKKTHARSLVYGSKWSDESYAREFFSLYRKCLEGKWKKTAVKLATDDILVGQSETGYFRVLRSGQLVGSVEDSASPL